MRRVDEAVLEVVSEVVQTELTDPRLGFVTITEVRTSPDLRHARVFVSVYGDASAQEQTLTALRSAHGVLQSHIGRELRLKRTPQLEFELDDTAERAARLDAMLAAEEERS